MLLPSAAHANHVQKKGYHNTPLINANCIYKGNPSLHRMFRPTLIQPRPLLVPAMLRIHRIPRVTLHGQRAYIAPEFELLALCIRSFNRLHKVVDSALLGGVLGLAGSYVFVAVRLCGFEAVHEGGEELAAGVLEDEGGHYCGDLAELVVRTRCTGSWGCLPAQRGSAAPRLRHQ